MTISVSVKVHDGVVLAADSATSLRSVDPEGQPLGVVNVYNHANKIFNLRKQLPIGCMTWGGGSIGSASIATLSKDLRDLLTYGADRSAGVEVEGRPDGDTQTSDATEQASWQLNPDQYTIQQVAALARRFFFEERYAPLHEGGEDGPNIGFMIAGYSAHANSPESWQFQIAGGQCAEPTPRQGPEDTGIAWSGEIEPVTRLVMGHGTELPRVLLQMGVDEDEIRTVMEQLRSHLELQLAHPAMPIQDAIDLATFLVGTSREFTRFRPGAPSIGGPIEVAAITKHEGFKWVQRKHYFSADLNPETDLPGIESSDREPTRQEENEQ